VIHPKTLLISRHFYSLESYVWRSIYNLKIDTISTYYIPLDRSFLKLWNGIRHVMPSTDRRLEIKEKTSMAQNAWQAFVYANNRLVQIIPHFKQVIALLLWQSVFLQFTFSSKLFCRESFFVSRELLFALHMEDSAQVNCKLIRRQLHLDYSSLVLPGSSPILKNTKRCHSGAINYERQPVRSSAWTATSIRHFTLLDSV